MEKCSDVRIIPYQASYRDDMIFMVLEAKDALGRIPRLNEDLLNINLHYVDKGDYFLLALDAAGRVVGCGGFHSIPGTKDAKLQRLYVKASRKRQGIGTLLLSALEAELCRRGVTGALVHLGGMEYFESRSFYPKHGYYAIAEDMMRKDFLL